jgi:hypothetical protein
MKYYMNKRADFSPTEVRGHRQTIGSNWSLNQSSTIPTRLYSGLKYRVEALNIEYLHVERNLVSVQVTCKFGLWIYTKGSNMVKLTVYQIHSSTKDPEPVRIGTGSSVV